MTLDQATLKSLLHYDPETGIFTWMRRANSTRGFNERFAGKVAGCEWTSSRGRSRTTYVIICVNGRIYQAHRLAWLYMTGEWPAFEVDHDDLNGRNNRWANLRPATRSQNQCNTGLSKRNRTGFKGVSVGIGGKFRATIQKNKKQIWLGDFNTAEEAYAAYCQAAADLHGEYARTA